MPGTVQLADFLTAFLRDLGSGLEIALYQDAVTHVFGVTETDIKVDIDGRNVGHQRFRLVAPGVALKITAFDSPLAPYEIHARRLLAHADLQAIAWVNITMKKVTFTTLKR